MAWSSSSCARTRRSRASPRGPDLATLDTEAVAFPDDVNIRQMCDAPGTRSGRVRVKSLEIPRRRHRRVRKAPT